MVLGQQGLEALGIAFGLGLALAVPATPVAAQESLLAQVYPEAATLERSISARGRRVYVDCLQNAAGKTLAAARAEVDGDAVVVRATTFNAGGRDGADAIGRAGECVKRAVAAFAGCLAVLAIAALAFHAWKEWRGREWRRVLAAHDAMVAAVV